MRKWLKRRPLNSRGAESGSTSTVPSRLDLLFQRSAWVAQITLVVGAVAGYFLTVRPVYQKQLLDEQIAEKTVALREMAGLLEKLKRGESQLRQERARPTEGDCATS